MARPFVPSIRRAERYEFHLAQLGFELSSDVKSGENRGRRLEHDFVVLAMHSVTANANRNLLSAEITSTIPPRFNPKRMAITVWITRQGELDPVQAVGGWLPQTKDR